MAIGDGIAVILGTAATSRQPSAGVFEKITAVSKGTATGASDKMSMYNGSNLIAFHSGVSTVDGGGTSGVRNLSVFKMCIMSGNSIYIHKSGTTDRFAVCGVQVDT